MNFLNSSKMRLKISKTSTMTTSSLSWTKSSVTTSGTIALPLSSSIACWCSKSSSSLFFLLNRSNQLESWNKFWQTKWKTRQFQTSPSLTISFCMSLLNPRTKISNSFWSARRKHSTKPSTCTTALTNATSARANWSVDTVQILMYY